MQETLTLSRGNIATYLACRRRFQLRYQEQLPWPIPPLDEKAEKARKMGQCFHEILHRHFLDLLITEGVANDPQLQRWWNLFVAEEGQLPTGRRLPELSVSVPIGRHVLTGRFDLLILGEQETHIYDWKTEARPRSELEMRRDLQTRLYLALAVEGGAALYQDIDPDRTTLIYWYVNDPAATVTIQYSRSQHAENWAYLQALVDDIEQQLASQGTLPLTGDLSQCDYCAYQIYCGRQMAQFDLQEGEPDEIQAYQEPERP
jgi:CRISPR/Cas system-associated exonuclease Cas4 (RecB family)